MKRIEYQLNAQIGRISDTIGYKRVMRNAVVSIKKLDANFNVKEVKPWVKISMHI